MTSLSITMSHRLFSWHSVLLLTPICSITESCCHRQQLGPCDACTRPFIFNLLKHQGTKETKSQDANESYVFLCLFFILWQYQVYRKDANAQSSKYQSMLSEQAGSAFSFHYWWQYGDALYVFCFYYSKPHNNTAPNLTFYCNNLKNVHC